MKSYIQILGSATGDSGPTIMLWFEKKRYLFNCSEGTLRFCSENHIKPAKLDTMFFTRVAWENIGGLAGTRTFFGISTSLLYTLCISNPT